MAVNAVNAPTLSFTNDLSENKTMVLPVGEFETGVQWVVPMDHGPAANQGPLFFLRVGFIGQLWGGAGFISANPENPTFGDRNLWLTGVSVLAGIQR